jgi:hypothetical protein
VSEARTLNLLSGARFERAAGKTLWRIAGVERGGGPVEVLFAQAASQLPARLDDVKLQQQHTAVAPAWTLHCAGAAPALTLQRVHIHRDVSSAFMAALTLPTASARARGGWYLLLNLLRLPGMARLLEMKRARR